MGNLPASEWDETEEIGYLGHSYWTIRSPLNSFRSGKFPFFHFHTGRPILTTPEGIHPAQKVNEIDRFKFLRRTEMGKTRKP